jgi:hypothetical protein
MTAGDGTAAGAGVGVVASLAEREQELMQLRIRSIAELEDQVQPTHTTTGSCTLTGLPPSVLMG